MFHLAHHVQLIRSIYTECHVEKDSEAEPATAGKTILIDWQCLPWAWVGHGSPCDGSFLSLYYTVPSPRTLVFASLKTSLGHQPTVLPLPLSTGQQPREEAGSGTLSWKTIRSWVTLVKVTFICASDPSSANSHLTSLIGPGDRRLQVGDF